MYSCIVAGCGEPTRNPDGICDKCRSNEEAMRMMEGLDLDIIL